MNYFNNLMLISSFDHWQLFLLCFEKNITLYFCWNKKKVVRKRTFKCYMLTVTELQNISIEKRFSHITSGKTQSWDTGEQQLSVHWTSLPMINSQKEIHPIILMVSFLITRIVFINFCHKLFVYNFLIFLKGDSY